jgi:hypothetical protein
MKANSISTSIFIIIFCCINTFVHSQEKQRVIVLTDINNETDDEESLVRFLVYSNEFDIEDIIATTSCWLRKDTFYKMVNILGNRQY